MATILAVCGTCGRTNPDCERDETEDPPQAVKVVADMCPTCARQWRCPHCGGPPNRVRYYDADGNELG